MSISYPSHQCVDQTQKMMRIIIQSGYAPYSGDGGRGEGAS